MKLLSQIDNLRNALLPEYEATKSLVKQVRARGFTLVYTFQSSGGKVVAVLNQTGKRAAGEVDQIVETHSDAIRLFLALEELSSHARAASMMKSTLIKTSRSGSLNV